MARQQLPNLADLHRSPEEAFKEDQLNLLLNQPPHEKWIKKHPIITVLNDEGKNVKLQYLPVEKVEFMLTRIFQQWRREIKNVQLILNSVVATVRVHYLNPVTGEWSYHDGCGACPVQTDKDAKAGDFSSLKTSGVQMAAPAAVSYALKDAAECLGKLFGKDLNRRDTSAFKGAYMGEEEKRPKSTPANTSASEYETPIGEKIEDDFDL